MKLQFKNQKFQSEAAKSVTDVFLGQSNFSMLEYTMDTGYDPSGQQELYDMVGFRNHPIVISEQQVLKNIRDIQIPAMLRPSESVDMSDLRLTIEMETGTGKTYTYIKTMYELNAIYGWSKFIIVVPSIAIREGVCKSFKIMSEHFAEEYGKRIQSFVYDSNKLNEIDKFANDSNMYVMIINTQAFNSKDFKEDGGKGKKGKKESRIIFKPQESFRYRVPMDVISATNPILIIDEPQSVLGANKDNNTRKALKEFKPLFTLLYSATHRDADIVNMIYRLDAVDAYNKKLVKKISVKGFEQKGTTATNGYLYLESIELSEGNPKARVSFDKKFNSGIKQITKIVDDGFDFYQNSGELQEYSDGFRIVSGGIDGKRRCINLLNGITLYEGESIGSVNELAIRREQIRETIRSHFDKERKLFKMGIKCLSLFFIDQVCNYRIYKDGGETSNGIYAELFEQEYNNILKENKQLDLFEDDKEYLAYLEKFDAKDVHDGYFSRDKKNKVVESKAKEGENEMRGFHLIMEAKEELLSFNNSVRFIFSHSALKEGWDNPNVFQICTLKDSDNKTKKRQEVGRGMRLCVNQYGERQDESVLHGDVFNVNNLTIIASESYNSFASKLQDETAEAIGDRPTIVEPSLFDGLIVTNARGEENKMDTLQASFLFAAMAAKGYVSEHGQLTKKYHDDKHQGVLDFGDKFNEFKKDITKKLDTVFDPKKSKPDNERDRKEANFDLKKFESRAFQELWKKINHKTYYTVDFNTEELVCNAINAIHEKLFVNPVTISVVTGTMDSIKSKEQLKKGEAIRKIGQETHDLAEVVGNNVKYDLVGKLVESTQLTRKVIVSILTRITETKFNLFKINPEEFIIKVGNIINEVKAIAVIEHVEYHKLNKTFMADTFSEASIVGKLGVNAMNSEKSLYDLIVVDSDTEMKFADDIEHESDVVVYVKLPNRFYINTPVGRYNPDWAVAFKEGTNIKHIYFVAETKSTLNPEERRPDENHRIECARRHFSAIAGANKVYDVVTNYSDLYRIVTDQN